MSEIDPGLEELTTDVLGPPTEAQADPSEAGTAEPTETQPEPLEASAEAPTLPPVEAPPAPPQTYEIDGQRYTLEELRALRTTAQQLPALQQKLLQERQEREAAARATAPPQVTPQAMRAAIRANFDTGVKEAVTQGFIEEDFATLYPDLAANMIMYRDVITMMSKTVQGMREEINEYRGNSEKQGRYNQVVSELENNLVAMSTTHPFYQGLQSPADRIAFSQYLWKMDLKIDQVRDPQVLSDMYVAYKRRSVLAPADKAKADATVKAAAAAARRNAKGDVGSSRPAAAPTEQVDPSLAALHEMVADHLRG